MNKNNKFHLILVIMFFMLSCIKERGGEVFKQQGVYECKKNACVEAPVFKFDSRSDSTRVFLKKNHRYLEFWDLNSKQLIRIYENIDDYSCKCIKNDKYE